MQENYQKDLRKSQKKVEKCRFFAILHVVSVSFFTTNVKSTLVKLYYLYGVVF